VGKFTQRGPDWIDLEATMRVLQALHECVCEVRISPQGIGGTGGLGVVCSMLWERLPGTDQESKLCVSSGWPCPEHATLIGHVYAGFLKLDFEASKEYTQIKLPGT